MHLGVLLCHRDVNQVELLTMLSSILKWDYMRRPALGVVLDLRSKCDSSPVLWHWLPIRQRSTVSNKNLSFRILAMFGGFDEPLMLGSKVGADDIIRKPLKTSTIREAIQRLLVQPRD
jgi:hypothetical protein